MQPPVRTGTLISDVAPFLAVMLQDKGKHALSQLIEVILLPPSPRSMTCITVAAFVVVPKSRGNACQMVKP